MDLQVQVMGNNPTWRQRIKYWINSIFPKFQYKSQYGIGLCGDYEYLPEDIKKMGITEEMLPVVIFNENDDKIVVDTDIPVYFGRGWTRICPKAYATLDGNKIRIKRENNF